MHHRQRKHSRELTMLCSVWEMHPNVGCMTKWVQLGLIRKESNDQGVFSIIKVSVAAGVEALKRNSWTQKTFLTLCSLVALLTEEGSDNNSTSININRTMEEDNHRGKLTDLMCLDNSDLWSSLCSSPSFWTLWLLQAQWEERLTNTLWDRTFNLENS